MISRSRFLLRLLVLLAIPAVPGLYVYGQDIVATIMKGERPKIAVPDFRGAGEAQQFMTTFNQVLARELENSGTLSVVSKSFYPVQVPQQPGDFKPPVTQPPARRGQEPRVVPQGPWLTDWSQPPVNANYLAFGYTAVQNGQLALLGWLYDVSKADPASAQVIAKAYFGPLNNDGARKVAQEFAADILSQFGIKSLAGSHIYYVSSRSGTKEIWGMDYDGQNQKQFTFYKTITTMPAISADATRLAFTSFLKGSPAILIHSLETGRRLPFYNQNASLNATPDFTPDGRQIVFSSTAGSSDFANLFVANADGTGLRRLTTARAVEVEPKVNPKNANELVFVSGRSGPAQLYRMNIDGTDIQRLTPGEGEAVNPDWHPDGRHIVFSWTRGYDPGTFNIFVMDVATQQVNQLTRGSGRNENPRWAPDGMHIVFCSNRSGATQIYTMLADGTQVRQLTTQGRNEKPVWR